MGYIPEHKYHKKIYRNRDRRENERKFEDDDFDEDLIVDESIKDPILKFAPNLRVATMALRQRMVNCGITDLWVLDRTGIYENAILQMAEILQPLDSLDYIRSSCFDELNTVSEVLHRLTLGQVILRSTRLDNDQGPITSYEGYLKLNYRSKDSDTRITIRNRPVSFNSEQTQTTIFPQCQILIKDLVGRTPAGAAIAGLDSSIRCGLRYAPDQYLNFRWIISLDSGTHNMDASGRAWKTIGPLSQAINQAKITPLSGINLADGEYTFHYYDPDTYLSPNSWEERNFGFNRFYTFSSGLDRIFQSMT